MSSQRDFSEKICLKNMFGHGVQALVIPQGRCKHSFTEWVHLGTRLKKLSLVLAALDVDIRSIGIEDEAKFGLF